MTASTSVDRFTAEFVRVFGDGPEVAVTPFSADLAWGSAGWPDAILFEIAIAADVLAIYPDDHGTTEAGDAEICVALEAAGAVASGPIPYHRLTAPELRDLLRTIDTAGDRTDDYPGLDDRIEEGPTLWRVRAEDGGEGHCGESDLEDAIEVGEDWLREGEWPYESTIDGRVYPDGLSHAARVCWVNEQRAVFSIVTSPPPEPPCPEDEDEEHDWTSEYEGGCSENPGVWGIDGGRLSISETCRRCGITRTRITESPNGGPGSEPETYYSDPDPEWVARHPEKDY